MLEFQNEIPDLAGAVCSGVLAQEFWHGGERISPANVLFLKVADGTWHRIVLDAGVLFWRVVPEPAAPLGDTNGEEYWRHPIVDLGTRYDLVGKRIANISATESIDSDDLQIDFVDGPILVLRDLRARDATDLEIRTRSG